MTFATSGTTLWTTNRDAIITRALRICGAIGQGETPTSQAITEGAEALNDLVKEYQTDGMPLWKVRTTTPFALTATQTYLIGIGQTVNQTAPLKVLQAFLHDTSVSPAIDSPMVIITKQDYTYLGVKQSPARPNQLLYEVPGAQTGLAGATSDMLGTITIYPLPDAISITNLSIGMVVQLPFQDFTTSTDVPDFPSYWNNALKWGLADDLAYEYGVGLSERSMISKKAAMKKEAALSFGTEEGSLYVWPRAQYHSVGGSNRE